MKDKKIGFFKKSSKIGIARLVLIFLIVALMFLISCKVIYIKENTVFKLKGKEIMDLEIKTHYKEPGFVATITGKDRKKDVKITSNIDENKLGVYTVEYSLKINWLGTRKIKRKVKVVDTTPPFLNIDSSENVLIDVGGTFEMPKYEAIDNLDGDITDKVSVNSSLDTNTEGVYDIVYTVEDSNNNKTVKKITVSVEPKWKNCYIEVSIANQTLNYYEKGELKLTSLVVTGIHNGTPRGTYKVLSKSRNVNLKGEDYVSHVDYWIAFIGHSYGFHDASWRSSFGGNIYLYNGSHGCVNMPRYKVAELYNMVEIGTPVYIR